MGSKLDRAVRQSESTGQEFLKIFKWPAGATDIRLLPAAKMDDEDDWFYAVGLHYGLEKYPVMCPNATDWAGDPCPICKTVEELRQSSMNDEANKYAVRKPFYARAIIRGQEDQGIQIVRLPSTLFKAITTLIKDTEAYGDVLSPGPHGRDIRITKDGQNLQTSYQANVLPKERPLLGTKEATIQILKDLPTISTIVEIPDQSELEAHVTATFGIASPLGDSAEASDSEDEGWDGDDSIVVGDWEDPRLEEADKPVEEEDDTWMEPDDSAPSAKEMMEKARAKDDIGDDIVEAIPGAKRGKSRSKKE